jgi:hypothetical protein
MKGCGYRADKRYLFFLFNLDVFVGVIGPIDGDRWLLADTPKVRHSNSAFGKERRWDCRPISGSGVEKPPPQNNFWSCCTHGGRHYIYLIHSRRLDWCCAYNERGP